MTSLVLDGCLQTETGENKMMETDNQTPGGNKMLGLPNLHQHSFHNLEISVLFDPGNQSIDYVAPFFPNGHSRVRPSL